MTESKDHRSPFRLLEGKSRRPVLGPLARLAEHTLGLARLGRLHRLVGDAPDARSYVDRCLGVLRVAGEAPESDRQRMPKDGPCVVVANHPFGVVEGLLILDQLLRVRSDVKVLANHVLTRFERLVDHMICVDPYGGARAAARNVRPLREAIAWVRQGGLLVTFPAGEVAHRRWGERTVLEPDWHGTVARILRITKATALPVFFGGHNGALFQLAGLAHPALRTLLLPRAMLHRMGRVVPMRIGKPIPFDRLERFESDGELVDYLRLRTLILGRRLVGERRGQGARRLVAKLKPKPKLVPIVPPLDAAQLAADIATLPPEMKLVESSGFEVWIGSADRMPSVLHEIGRLREETFREVGEGTGRSTDLDRYDDDYLHLFVWRPEERVVVGAYRLGCVDALLKKGGQGALYTTSLFEFDPEFLDHVRNGLEVGRSFVRREYQRSYMPLMLLWRGIGAWIVRNPRYSKLFGPVSISATYERASRELMVDHLREHEFMPEFANHVHPRHPVRGGVVKRFGLRWTASMLGDLGDVSAMVAEMETDQKGVPVLIREYLKLGGKIVGFNVDPAFRDVVDGLVVVDLLETDPRILARHLGKDGARSFREFHGAGAELGA
ncbi:MAG: lysophospholipid acyltransferase family protein [Planctomycetes bacterium]|nr:lysophospholipid acyltransferase family protein [Planctomycetota bacterium]